jgi:hypothetical protein
MHLPVIGAAHVLMTAGLLFLPLFFAIDLTLALHEQERSSNAADKPPDDVEQS